jgi:hypothetical protein
MRRGRKYSGLVALVAMAAFFVVVPSAFADGGTPMDICQDLQDGKLDGSYTYAQLQAFFSDPTVQGYCGPVTVIVTPPPAVVVTPPTTPPTTPPAAPAPGAQPTPSAVVSAVQGARHTVATPAVTRVKGSRHTVNTPVSTAAPLAATKTKGTLPFTGAQLALFTLVGLALVATGLVLRSTARRDRRS